MNPDWVNALLGGVLIGLAVSLMLLWNGRVTGIAGILYGKLTPTRGDTSWRYFFVAGLVLGGFVLSALKPEIFSGALNAPGWTVPVAGLLVGFGTVMGSGCTSGHGVCGLSRMSIRSLLATVAFMASGILAVFVFRTLGVLS